MSYRLTSAIAVRAEFWREHPMLSRTKIPNYSGKGTMYVTDTRCAFCDYVDMLSKDGSISQDLAQRITLSY